MYLSWDIGIKNLAYCMLDYDKDSNKTKIYKWGIINLIETISHDVKMLKCSCLLKNKKEQLHRHCLHMYVLFCF